MAVYEKNYHPYTGSLTRERSRFLVLPRYAYREVFASRLFVAFFALCFICPLGVAVLIYLPHNLRFLETFGVTAASIMTFFRFDGSFFLRWFMVPQGTLAFFVSLVVGPTMISADLKNNALPLYFSRPFSRTEYILGKAFVLVFLLSLITWIPGLLLFLLQAYLAGGDWFAEHWRVGIGIFLGSWIWIGILCLLSLALSAYLKWKPVAQAAMFGVFFVASMLAGLVNLMFGTEWASLLNIGDMIHVIWSQLFDVPSTVGIPAWAAWMSLLALCAGCLGLLARKIRAYEVVRS